MKLRSVFLFVCAFVLSTTLFSQNSLSEKDKAHAVKYLNETETELVKAVSGLNDEQLNFKPSEESWSIANCVEHLALSENNLMAAIKKSMEEKASAETIKELQMSDGDLLTIITDRSNKVKTSKPFEPSDSFGSYSETLKAFKDRRKNSIKFVKSDNVNLRNYVLNFPFGKIDAYQAILFMSGHTNRHVQQIEEIKADQNFPK
ncbi:DinB family protein [Zhouia spongiae]|uniref:DinB family protein n=1 Tax=Zhouia spongiae TaxID=2202721 RepID=A0ABY3YMH2_9FLAO|nr:DinB family protein [Zhouia spongiae]UNY98861.1 DinB family protein [Zhouia spongiae]